MTEKNDESKIESKAWLTTLLIGLGVTLLSAGSAFLEVFQSDPYEWRHAGRALQFILLMGLPVLTLSVILWFARYKKMPSLAFVVTALTGGFWLLFSLAEIIGGLVEGEGAEMANLSIGAMMEIAAFSLPLIIVAWFLWAKPRIGAILLMILGFGMGLFMLKIGWNAPEEFGDWIIISVFTAVPFFLGLFTFLREIIKPQNNLASDT